jgi:hypothetical protein
LQRPFRTDRLWFARHADPSRWRLRWTTAPRDDEWRLAERGPGHRLDEIDPNHWRDRTCTAELARHAVRDLRRGHPIRSSEEDPQTFVVLDHLPLASRHGWLPRKSRIPFVGS